MMMVLGTHRCIGVCLFSLLSHFFEKGRGLEKCCSCIDDIVVVVVVVVVVVIVMRVSDLSRGGDLCCSQKIIL